MILLDKGNAAIELNKLKTLKLILESTVKVTIDDTAGRGSVVEDLKMITSTAGEIKKNMALLIDSTAAFLENCINEMTEKDEGIAAEIRSQADAIRGDK